jgi:hypothetical protein
LDHDHVEGLKNKYTWLDPILLEEMKCSFTIHTCRKLFSNLVPGTKTDEARNTIEIAEQKHITYEWKMKDKWNSITVQSVINKDKIAPSSIEEFIFERYFGFTKLSPSSTQEYRIHHPKWMTNKILNSNIDCNFGIMYGAAFSNLNNQAPSSIIMAEGSQVSVNWKRKQF